MLILDPVGDLLTRLRNAQKSGKDFVSCPFSKERSAVLKVLLDEGYISGFSVEKDEFGFDSLKIKLKYFLGTGAIKKIKRVSKPSRRVYSSISKLKPVFNGLGINILSTSKGVMSDSEARKLSVGGEVLCSVF